MYPKSFFVRPKAITAAALILVTAALAQQPAERSDQLAVLEGSVLQSVTKEPVRKARVTLQSLDREQATALVAITDDAGRFRFADVPPARYNLTTHKSGFLDGAYGEDRPGGNDSLLTISAGERTEDLKLLLFPAGSISGQTLDADGDPLADAEVSLWSRPVFRGRTGKLRVLNQAITGRDGQYRFDRLPPRDVLRQRSLWRPRNQHASDLGR